MHFLSGLVQLVVDVGYFLDQLQSFLVFEGEFVCEELQFGLVGLAGGCGRKNHLLFLEIVLLQIAVVFQQTIVLDSFVLQQVAKFVQLGPGSVPARLAQLAPLLGVGLDLALFVCSSAFAQDLVSVFVVEGFYVVVGVVGVVGRVGGAGRTQFSHLLGGAEGVLGVYLLQTALAVLHVVAFLDVQHLNIFPGDHQLLDLFGFCCQDRLVVLGQGGQFGLEGLDVGGFGVESALQRGDGGAEVLGLVLGLAAFLLVLALQLDILFFFLG